jgi:cytochrome c biogenesis protein CcdA
MAKPESQKPTRMEKLRAAVDVLRSRTRWRDPERWLMIIGGFLLVFGLGAIGLAWYGAARTPYLFEQIPYLISGGLLGLGLAFVGGFLYFGYWLTRLVRQNREQSARLERTLEQIRDGLMPRHGSNGAFVATANGTMFHRPECPLVANRDDIHSVENVESGLEPCRVCKPLDGTPETQPLP